MKNINFKPDFLIIPKEVAFNKELQPLDKQVYGVIYWLKCLAGKECNASNNFMAQILDVPNRSVRRSLERLEDLGFIQRIFDENNHRQKIVPLIVFISQENKNLNENFNENQVIQEEIAQTEQSNNQDEGLNDVEGEDQMDRGEDQMDRGEDQMDRGGGPNGPQINNNKINNNNNNNIAKLENFADKNPPNDAYKINQVIDLFKNISPLSYSDFFKNKTERKAVIELLKKLPEKDLEILISKILPQLNILFYIPQNCKAFKPSEVLRNLDRILTKIKELKLQRSGKYKKIPIIGK